MLDKIKTIPDVPETLRIAASTQQLVPFIGAGVSAAINSPKGKALDMRHAASQKILELKNQAIDIRDSLAKVMF